jgi:hypothetical protein
MNNNFNWLKILAIIMVVSNLILVGLFFLPRMDHRPPHPRDLKEEIIDALELDENQKKTYLNLASEHHELQLEQSKRIEEAKAQIYLHLTDADTLLQDSLWTNVSNAFMEMERIHYQHFLDIKALCTQEQFPRYQALSKRFAKWFHPSAHGHGRD